MFLIAQYDTRYIILLKRVCNMLVDHITSNYKQTRMYHSLTSILRMSCAVVSAKPTPRDIVCGFYI